MLHDTLTEKETDAKAKKDWRWRSTCCRWCPRLVSNRLWSAAIAAALSWWFWKQSGHYSLVALALFPTIKHENLPLTKLCSKSHYGQTKRQTPFALTKQVAAHTCSWWLLKPHWRRYIKGLHLSELQLVCSKSKPEIAHNLLHSLEQENTVTYLN